MKSSSTTIDNTSEAFGLAFSEHGQVPPILDSKAVTSCSVLRVKMSYSGKRPNRQVACHFFLNFSWISHNRRRRRSPAKLQENDLREMYEPCDILPHRFSVSAAQPQVHSGLGFPSSIRRRKPVSQAATPWRKSSIAVLSPPLKS
jgi:hypothetical protein